MSVASDTHSARAATADRNTRNTTAKHSRGGMSVVRQLHRATDEPLALDPERFHGISIEELGTLRQEVQRRCRISNGLMWRRDLRQAHGECVNSTLLSTVKARHTEGSELVLHVKPVLPHVHTPRIERFASVQKLMGDNNVTPGPGDYEPRAAPTRINDRWVAFLPSAPAQRLQSVLETMAPGPQSYNPRRSAIDAVAPKCTIIARRADLQQDSNSKFAVATSYVPPLSDFEVDRRMPNGATAARFYVARAMQHASPGPLDTAREGATQWVWHAAGGDKHWRPVGRSDCMDSLAPPESVVEALKLRREARASASAASASASASAAHRSASNARSSTAAADAADGNDSTGTPSTVAAPRAAAPQRNSSSGRAISSAHHPALLLLSELHRRGFQLLRFAVEPVTRAWSGSPSRGVGGGDATTEQPQPQPQPQPPQPSDPAAGLRVHIATKFCVRDGFSLKPGVAVKDSAVLDAAKYMNAAAAPPASPQPPQQGGTGGSATASASASTPIPHPPKSRVAAAVDALLAANPEFAVRAKGRDFTYVAWLDKILRGTGTSGGQLAAGDVPVATADDDRTGLVHSITARGLTLPAPPMK